MGLDIEQLRTIISRYLQVDDVFPVHMRSITYGKTPLPSRMPAAVIEVHLDSPKRSSRSTPLVLRPLVCNLKENCVMLRLTLKVME